MAIMTRYEVKHALKIVFSKGQKCHCPIQTTQEVVIQICADGQGALNGHRYCSLPPPHLSLSPSPLPPLCSLCF